MRRPIAVDRRRTVGPVNRFSELQERRHGRNPVAKAQKAAASQETAGTFDES